MGWHSQLREDVESDERTLFKITSLATQMIWVRVYRIKYDIGADIAEMTVCRVCESCGISVSVSFASSLEEGVTQGR